MTYGSQTLESKVFKICTVPRNAWKRRSSLFRLSRNVPHYMKAKFSVIIERRELLSQTVNPIF